MLARICYNFRMGVHIKSYAKINLTLDITGVQGGYHTLESLACTIDVADSITLKKRKDGLVNVFMRGMGSETIPPELNNAKRAGDMFVRTFGTTGADITVYKNIPIGAGLGGSSADAAGVLRGMSKLYKKGTPEELSALAATLGSDVPYMLRGGFARISGRGETVIPVSSVLKLFFLIATPPQGVSTAECYRRYGERAAVPRATFEAERALKKGDIYTLGRTLFNALTPPAVSLNPQIETALNELCAFFPVGVSMTGSGSAAYALFDSPELCAWAKSRYKGSFPCFTAKSVPAYKD